MKTLVITFLIKIDVVFFLLYKKDKNNKEKKKGEKK